MLKVTLIVVSSLLNHCWMFLMKLLKELHPEFGDLAECT